MSTSYFNLFYHGEVYNDVQISLNSTDKVRYSVIDDLLSVLHRSHLTIEQIVTNREEVGRSSPRVD